jgi:hypothetical protein
MLIMRRVRSADDRTPRSRNYESESNIGYGMATPRYAGSGRRDAASGEYSGASQPGGAFTQAKNTASSLMHGTAETVSNVGYQAKEGAMRAGRGLQRMLNENPLAVGAAAVAVGAAVGLALPRTRIEHDYMGEASEKLVDKAQQVARDAMDKVKSATASQGQGGGPAQQPQPAQQPKPGQQTQGHEMKPGRPGGTPTA